MLREREVLAQVVSFVAMASEMGRFGSRMVARVQRQWTRAVGVRVMGCGGGCEYLSGRRMRLMRWYW